VLHRHFNFIMITLKRLRNNLIRNMKYKNLKIVKLHQIVKLNS
jgi:hypothetical protein